MIYKPYILSIDPGLTSGVALVQRDPLKLLRSDELDWQNTARFVDTALREFGGEHVDVVLEKFTITTQTAKNSQQTWSLEVIGMCRLMAMAHGAGAITLQSPADAKTFASNMRLKNLELWHVGGDGHANDALRHVVLRLTRTGWKDSRLLLT